MNFRGIRFGALLVPLAVALFPVGVLLWYGFLHIPAQEAYLTERNLRLLTTLSSAVRAKIESYDGALDHAVASIGDKHLTEGVHLFAPDLDVVRVDDGSKAAADARREAAGSSDLDWQLLSEAADPPRVAVTRDEGRYYLYLGANPEANGRTIRVVARADLEAVVAPLLVDTTHEFAAILLTTDTGLVIAQHAPLGLSLARLDGVVNLRRTAPAGKEAAAPLVKFADLVTFSNVVPVSIGEIDYKLYMQPVPLSLLSRNGGKGGREPEQWVLCGLVRGDRFKADSSALSYPTLLWFSGFLAVFTVALPFVKLRGLGPRERFRASDVRWVNTAGFLLVALLTFAALDVLAFWNQFGDRVDARLTRIADALTTGVNTEVSAIEAQANAFDSGAYPDGKPIGKVFPGVLAQLPAGSPTIIVQPDDLRNPVRCEPPEGCRPHLLNEQWFDPPKGQAPSPYPFFDLVTWAGRDGWQRVRYTSAQSFRPFLNIFDDDLPYGNKARAAWATPQNAPNKGIEVESSPNTGEPLTIFWRTGRQNNVSWVQSLAFSSLIAFDQPALPKGVSFAVVDPEGLVLFHSISNRRLRENFLKECEDDAALGALIRTGKSDHVRATYQGRPARFFVEPLTLRGTSRDDTIEDPQWRLAVFQDSALVDTVNLETLTIACWLFAVYACLLVLTAAAVRALSPRAPEKWFWPDPARSSTYRSILFLNLCAILAFAVLFLIGTSWSALRTALLVTTTIGAVAAYVVTYRLATRATPESHGTVAFGVAHTFFFARAAFLAVVAGLPAIACFQTAYTYEATLLAKVESAEHAQTPTPKERSLKVFRSLGLDASLAEGFARRRASFVSTQTAAPLWQERNAGDDAAGRVELTSADPGVVDRWLFLMHRSYNDVASDLRASAGTATAQVPSPVLNYVSLLPFIGGLCALCCVIMNWLARPTFALDVAAPGTSVPKGVGHVLVVGPPGSGKSTRLAAVPDIRVFDVAVQDWVERRRNAVPVPTERRQFAVVGAAVGGPGGGGWPPARFGAAGSPPSTPTASAPPISGWANSLEASTLPPVLGIDHVDYRLREREFAAQTLAIVERAVYRNKGVVRIVSDRDPLMCLRENDATTADLDRWARVLRHFRRESVGLATHAPSAFDESDAPYYESLWSACTLDERLALCQLAEERVVNPQNPLVIGGLLQAGLIVRTPSLQIMNESFKDFVSQAATPGQIGAWERRGVVIPWSTIEVAMLTVVVTLAGLLIVTQEQLLNAWIGFIPAFLPAAQKLVKAVAGLRLPPTDGPVAA